MRPLADTFQIGSPCDDPTLGGWGRRGYSSRTEHRRPEVTSRGQGCGGPPPPLLHHQSSVFLTSPCKPSRSEAESGLPPRTVYIRTQCQLLQEQGSRRPPWRRGVVLPSPFCAKHVLLPPAPHPVESSSANLSWCQHETQSARAPSDCLRLGGRNWAGCLDHHGHHLTEKKERNLAGSNFVSVRRTTDFSLCCKL